METITKLQLGLLNHYNNGEISESELIHELRYVKEAHDIMELKQSIAHILDVYVDELCNMDNISSMHKLLTEEYKRLKELLVVPAVISSVDDSVGEEDEKVDEDEHMKSVYNIIKYHIHLMTMYNDEDISSKLFVDVMGDACDLNRPVYKDIVEQVEELLKELPSYPIISNQHDVMETMDVSNVLIHTLYTHEDGGEKLQELYEEYTDIIKETIKVVAVRSGRLAM